MSETEHEIEEAEAEQEAAEQPAEADETEGDETPEGVDPETGEIIEEAQGPLRDETLASMSARDIQRVIERGTMTEDEVEKALARFEKKQADILDKLNREGGRHRDRLAEILTEDILACVPCPMCRPDLAGWIDTRAPISEEQKQAIRIQIGDRKPRVLKPDPYSHPCDACGGAGEVDMGTNTDQPTVMPCVDCNGKGWVPNENGPRSNRVVPFAPTTTSSVDAPVAPPPADLSEIPEWVRERFILMPKQAGG